MPYSAEDFEYGPVYVLRGPHKGRIGEFDDDAYERGRMYAIVQFAPFGLASYESLIPLSYLRAPNTNDLLKRYEEIWRTATVYSPDTVHGDDRIRALEEFAYVNAGHTLWLVDGPARGAAP